MDHCEGKHSPEGSSSYLQQRWAQRGGRKAEQSCVCVSVCMALPSPAAQLRQCRDVVTSAEQELDTVLGAAGRVWRPAVTVKALQSSPAASQASSRKSGHFSFSSGGHCLAYTNILYFPVVIFGGRWEDTMKFLGQFFFINAPSLFHSSVFYLDYEYLSSQSFWLW